MIDRILERFREASRKDIFDKQDYILLRDANKIVQEVAKEYSNASDTDLTVVSALPSLYPLQKFEEEAIHKVVASAKDGGWIPCSERLPKCEWGAETKALLFQMAETNTIYCGYYGEGGKYRDKYFRTYTNATDGFDMKDVIAWQPLPAPYQKGE